MTISTQTTKAIYAGNGSSVNFPITFPFGLDQNNLAVYITDLAGSITKLTASQYEYVESELKIVYPKTEVPALPPLASGYKLTIAREVAAVQELDLVNQGPFTPQMIESTFDRLTMLIQELNEKISRCIIYPVDQNPSSTETSGFLAEVLAAKSEAINGANMASSYMDNALIYSNDASASKGAAQLAETNASLASAGLGANQGTRSSGVSLSAGSVISPIAQKAIQTIFVVGNGGPVTLTSASPILTTGMTIGQEVEIIGTSDTNTVTLQSSVGLILNGSSKELMKDYLIKLKFIGSDGTNSSWIEVGSNF